MACATSSQDVLVRQDIDWGLSVPEALDHLLTGHTDSDAEYAGNAYHAAMQIIIDPNASDPGHLGTYSKPATFFSHVEEVMQNLGVPAELLPYEFICPTSLPAGFPYLPHSVDVYPAIGYMPLEKAKPAGDAYRAVLDQLDPSTRYDIQELVNMLEDEHEHWVYGTEKLDWYTQNTLFFASPERPAGMRSPGPRAADPGLRYAASRSPEYERWFMSTGTDTAKQPHGVC